MPAPPLLLLARRQPLPRALRSLSSRAGLPTASDPVRSRNRAVGAALAAFALGVAAYTMWGIRRLTDSTLGPEFNQKKGESRE